MRVGIKWGMPPDRQLPMFRPSVLLLSLVLTLFASAGAQAFEWRDVEQLAEIQADGSVIVYDTRTLWTDDDFGEAFICFELEGRQTIELLPGSGAVSFWPVLFPVLVR